MKNKFLEIYKRHKYKMGIFVLLGLASMMCILLVVARVEYANSRRYVMLIWNLFLAWIPFVLAFMAYMLSWNRKRVFIVIPVFAFVWLIFFPNAPYILTDLQHLSQGNTKSPIWYDVIMLVWFSWTGMLLGIVSLNLMQEIIRREFSRVTGWVFVFFVSGLSGVGIYFGRFIRLNSWDILKAPEETVDSFGSWLTDPSLKSIGFIGLYTVFFIFVYLTLYAFGHILQENSQTEIINLDD